MSSGHLLLIFFHTSDNVQVDKVVTCQSSRNPANPTDSESFLLL